MQDSANLEKPTKNIWEVLKTSFMNVYEVY